MFEDILIYFLIFAKYALVALSIIFIISGFDELFIDFVYAARLVYRRAFVYSKHKRLTEEQLLAKPEQPIAIMIPCWDESAVIRRMLSNTIRTLNYSNYHIFVGTYPNDQATQREVELAREEFGKVSRIVCPKDGPTNKADCLNWVYEGIKLYEKEHDIRFEVFVMEDSEDIIHPLTLRLFNYLIPRMDMVQLPVFPMPTPWYKFTAGHYLDEFAENHARDMTVREILSGAIPSAGVGTGYSRLALDSLATDNQHQLFNVDSLTEDYDIGMRLQKYDLKQVFVRHAIERKSSTKSWLTGKTRTRTVREYIVIREFFPQTFSTAVRQKSRWVLGIALQGWARLGWKGSIWTRYMLFRDRKALLTNLISMSANVLAVPLILMWAYQEMNPDAYRYPPLVQKDSWVWYMILMNMGFLLWRVLMRMSFVNRAYGPFNALFALPHLVWGNVINFFATVRAIRLYVRYLITGKIVAWDKTAHVFPSEEELTAYRRKLGDLLLDKRFVSVGQLDKALEEQRRTGKPLGRALLDLGFVSEDELLQVLGQQLRIDTREIDPYAVPLDVVALLPRDLAEMHHVFPVAVREDGALELAVERPLPMEVVQGIEETISRPLAQCLAAKSDLSFAISRGYERLNAKVPPQCPWTGREALKRNLCTENQLAEALRLQRRAYARLGDVLVSRGALGYQDLLAAEDEYFAKSNGHRFGEFLVHTGRIGQEQLDEALKAQRESQLKLGQALVTACELTPEEVRELLAFRKDQPCEIA
ncbi:General secretory system II protein E domain protein [Alkalidesulfovibrio alkalitolerans DSM 16529]|uniref:General secretory system II protein E domain protein n=1 Tax=Alkalidesulfovibrio alkalitolerans DSM 16529 TaxID=1121439 RepID=S7T8V8_9BACT|nr:glycosyl transferase family protein [Alkalidesulfovibrio alkalitolerans]EPR33036.1 General secretory system II protein E domain protein [Alkalidesulfovibrio alkalitolerans DSM 16529]